MAAELRIRVERFSRKSTMSELPRPLVRRHAVLTGVAAAALLLAGLLLRLVPLGRESMRGDEMWTASYTNLSLFETVVATLRFDVHPPLYYIQVNLWSALSRSDTWLMLNPVLWGMITLFLVFVIVRKRLGTRAALIALACDAVLGSEMYFADELRPYTMFTALMLASWIAADRLFATYRFRASIPLILILIVIGGSHSFGSIGASAALLYILPYGRSLPGKPGLRTWLAISAIVGIATLPWLVNASLRHVGHMSPITLPTIVDTISGWALGYGAIKTSVALQTAVTAAIVLIVGTALYRIPALRRMIICYLLWPLGFTIVASLLWKPIWLFRPFSYCAPLVAIAFGAVVDDILSRLERQHSLWAVRISTGLAAAIPLLALGCFSYAQGVTPRKTQYGAAATYLKEHVQPGDIIYVPEMMTFWGVARYFVGPDWGSPLKVQDPLNQDRSQYWPRIYGRLGERKMKWLHLQPQTRLIDSAVAKLYIGWTPLPAVARASSTWIVGPTGAVTFSLNDVTLPCAYKTLGTTDFMDLRVYHIICASTDTTPPESSTASDSSGIAHPTIVGGSS
ncbi:MAG: glycosyltransferase family 39 protein [Steroidobacteraceae bacterium]